MSELTPMNRTEALLAGEYLEPMNRLEHFLKEAASGGGGGAPVTVTNASFLSDITTFLTALMTASTDTAIRIKRGNTMTGDEELFEAFKSIHENGSPLEVTLLGYYTFVMRPVMSRTYTEGNEVFYYVQLVNEFFQYSSNYKLAFEIYASKATDPTDPTYITYHYQLGMTCVKMTVLT